MSERPFPPPGDDDLDAALRARRRLVPQFDTHLDDEPSPDLDRLVLARARAALQLESPPERHYRGPRWAVPVSIAATVLLSLGLVLQMDPSRNDAVLASRGDEAATSAMRATERAESATAAGATASADADTSAGAASAPPAEVPAPALARTAAPEGASERASGPAPAPAVALAPAQERAESPASAQSPAPAATADRATRNGGFLADAQTAADVAIQRKQAAPGSTAAAPSEAPGASRSGATAAASADAASAANEEIVTTAAAPRPRAAAAPPAVSPDDQAARDAIPRDDPQRWLVAIERLRVAGEFDAARRELAAFRARHPDLPLPESLDALR